MNLHATYAHLGALLKDGAPPDLAVVSMIEGQLCELLDETLMVHGQYKADPSPKLSAYRPAVGPMLVFVPITEEPADLLNSGTHRLIDKSAIVSPLTPTEPARLTPTEHRSALPSQLREIAGRKGLQASSKAQQAILNAAAEIEGGEEAFAALAEECRQLKAKLANTERNLRAAYDLIANARKVAKK